MATTGRELTPSEITKFKIQFNQEMGSAFQYDDHFFANFDGGDVFDQGLWEATDLQAMLRKDGSARAIQQVLTGPIRAASWTLKPGKGDTGQAAWVEEFLRLPATQGGMKIPMSTLIAQALSARTYRRAFFEKVYTKGQDGKIVYEKIAYRPPGTCGVRRDPKTGAYRGYRQRPIRKLITTGLDWAGIDIDPAYAWVHINGTWIDPIKGSSDMEVPYWCHTQKMKLLFLWFLFLETQATPRTIITSSNNENVNENARKIASMKGGGTIGLPQTSEVKNIESNGLGAKLFMDAIMWLDRTMAESVLAGFLNLTGSASSGSRGSQALSKDSSAFFLEQENSVAAELQDSITNQVIAPLIYLNWGPDAPIPSFEFGTIGDGDIDRIVSLITGLAAQPQSPFPAAFLVKLAEKASNYLDIDLTDIQDEIATSQKQAETLADVNVQSAQEKLNQLKNPPQPAMMPGGVVPKPGGPPKPGLPAKAAGFGAAVNTIAAKAQAAQKAAAKGGSSVKPAAPAAKPKPAAGGPAAK